jgi:hypothetical protein
MRLLRLPGYAQTRIPPIGSAGNYPENALDRIHRRIHRFRGAGLVSRPRRRKDAGVAESYHPARERQSAGGRTFAELLDRLGCDPGVLRFVLNDEVRRGHVDYDPATDTYRLNGGLDADVKAGDPRPAGLSGRVRPWAASSGRAANLLGEWTAAERLGWTSHRSWPQQQVSRSPGSSP